MRETTNKQVTAQVDGLSWEHGEHVTTGFDRKFILQGERSD